jgi:hypothetical protein
VEKQKIMICLFIIVEISLIILCLYDSNYIKNNKIYFLIQ